MIYHTNFGRSLLEKGARAVIAAEKIEPFNDHAAKASDQSVSISWQTSQLPYFTLWKNTSAEADGYVTGLEPGTGFPFNRNTERKFGRVPKLAPGESRSFELDYSLHDGAKAVGEAEALINKLQGAPPQLASEPPMIPE